jgi:polar amino acid transport system permease protein
MNWSWPEFRGELFSMGFFQAALTTVWITAVVEVLALALAVVLALGALSRHRTWVVLTGVYIWIWRGTPILIQLLIIYFGLPQLGLRPSIIEAAIAGLALNEAAFLGVLLRANLLSIAAGQADAARALGMTRGQRMRLVLLPQAARTFLPTLGNQVNSMIKTTSLVSVLSVQELLAYTQNVVSQTYQPFEAFAVATIYYLAISTIWSVIQYCSEWWLNRSGRQPRRPGRPRSAVARLSDGRSIQEVA